LEIYPKFHMTGKDMLESLSDLLRLLLNAQQSLSGGFVVSSFEIQMLGKVTLAVELTLKTLELRR
jgi:hypothetical protein